MQAVILAGGEGTRLRPYTMVLPKPMMPVGEKPILEIIINNFAENGIKNIVISVGYLAGIIRAYFGYGERFGVEIEYLVEKEPLGTAGCLAIIKDLEDEFIVSNGDILTNLTFVKLIEHHRKSGKNITICAHEKAVSVSLGVLELNGSILEDYIEKPTYKFYVSMGVYIINKEVVKYISPNSYCDFPTLIKKLISLNEPINVYKFNGEWYDIGREEDYKQVLEKFS